MTEFDNTNFDAVKISLASTKDIRDWSYGEVKKPETINYRTQKPEKDGLFCEKIFGPVKDWECSCGKYKGIRFKGIKCERCGVEVTTSKVRRERMGHIELAAPVSHIWHFKTSMVFSLTRMLNMKSKDLEKVLYFASYVITSVDTKAREADAAVLKEELEADLEQLDAERDEQIERMRANQAEGIVDEFDGSEVLSDDDLAAAIVDLREEYEEEKALRREAYDKFMTLQERDLISDESLFRELKRYYKIYFKGGMGAEAVRDLLSAIDLEKEAQELRAVISDENANKTAYKEAVKRLSTVGAFLEGDNDPADMILDVIPVIPPDLRPMVPLDGGRFAVSDLNDLYRRVVNRNNRLKRLLDLDAPAIIVNNEKRMLQESVDALFDNGKRGQAAKGRGGRPLKSLAEALSGKQGRFRQNLLGKRVDYSGRSVIVTDPSLKLHQCGLPKDMALELFKPFVMRRLVELKVAGIENVKSAKRAIDRHQDFVWDVLDEVIEGRLVLLNRAPTLHRLSIQAFEPVLVEGKAIHLHPLVCAPFNADFDGDQMSVHVPLSTKAQTEARVLMLSSNNLRSPASGKVLTVPSQDMIFGVYFLTTAKDGVDGEGHVFASFEDALTAYDNRIKLDIQAKIQVRVSAKDANTEVDGKKIFRVNNGKGDVVDYDVTEKPVRFETTVGRVIFNRQCLPEDYPYINYKMVKSDVSRLVNDCCDRYPLAQVGPILDDIKYSGFHYATRAGLSVSVWDAVIPDCKEKMLAEAQENVNNINENYELGALSEDERHKEVVDAWTECTESLGVAMLEGFEEDNPIYMMADSGARGSKTQLRQLAGMRGLMADMSGDTIDLPIKANFREGLLPLEYFISTYGARKGLVDTASHTSESGYLTRRLVDVAQDVIVREEDCGTTEGVTYNLIKPGATSVDTELIGRCVLNDVVAPKSKKVLMEAGSYIESAADLEKLVEAGLKTVELRALLSCHSKNGVCQKCYGWDLSTRRPVNVGTAVGVIAAQSIGEPGTQLTMRTIHSGGVAGVDDITQGLPTVSRMFDIVGNVNEKILGREADLASFSGKLSIQPEQSEYVVRILDVDDETRVLDELRVPASAPFMPGIEDGVVVPSGAQLTKGFVNFKKLRQLTDIESTMHTFVNSVKEVYSSQGVELNDKHLEVIARQMLRRVEITNPGDSNYLMGDDVDRFEFAETVNKITLAGGTPPEAVPVILGVGIAASSVDSWLSSASFVRTSAVLTQSAIAGKVDNLTDLKANVIVGRKIPAGTGLSVYEDVALTYHGEKISGPTSPNATKLPSYAPEEVKEVEEKLPQQLDWVGDDYGNSSFSKNGRTLSSDEAKLYLFDDLGVSQRWTNKFGEVGIETVGDLIGKTEDELLHIDGIGGKAIEELREGLEKKGLLYILEPDDSVADDEDLSQLLNMVFSPDDTDVMLGTAIPSTHHVDDELIGAPSQSSYENSDAINENVDSLDDIFSQIARHEAAMADEDDDD